MVLHIRGVAQPGSAPGLGPGGRRFESCRPDQFIKKLHSCFKDEAFLFYKTVATVFQSMATFINHWQHRYIL